VAQLSAENPYNLYICQSDFMQQFRKTMFREMYLIDIFALFGTHVHPACDLLLFE